jgi:hypothetical protein
MGVEPLAPLLWPGVCFARSNVSRGAAYPFSLSAAGGVRRALMATFLSRIIGRVYPQFTFV